MRDRWHVDNKSRHVQDATFGEDGSRARTGRLPRALAAIRNA